MLDLGGVVGYIDEMQHIIRCKVGRKIVGMNFQTRSRQGQRCQRSLRKANFTGKAGEGGIAGLRLAGGQPFP